VLLVRPVPGPPPRVALAPALWPLRLLPGRSVRGRRALRVVPLRAPLASVSALLGSSLRALRQQSQRSPPRRHPPIARVRHALSLPGRRLLSRRPVPLVPLALPVRRCD
jgi:hypothetical protein